MKLLEIAPRDRIRQFALLLLAALFAVVGALLLQSTGQFKGPVTPLTFVSAIVALKLSLFAFWPMMKDRLRFDDLGFVEAAKPKEKSERRRVSRSISLWSDGDPRLDISLFDANVPTMIINHADKILDWNPAFELVFGEVDGLRQGSTLDVWFNACDNFRSVSKRSEELYGDGVLPLSDRERVSFNSKRFGRMVFIKIMNPIIDRSNGKFIGWTIVLNINSVNKRSDFLSALHDRIKDAGHAARYAAAYDKVYGAYSGYQSILRFALAAVEEKASVIDFGGGTGLFAQAHLRKNELARVTVVDLDREMLRQARLKSKRYAGRMKLVRQDLNVVTNLPIGRYQAAACLNVHHVLRSPGEFFAEVAKCLVSGGTFVIAHMNPNGNIATTINLIREEFDSKDKFEILKHLFHQVEEYERRFAIDQRMCAMNSESLESLLMANGFKIERRQLTAEGGWCLVCRRV